MQSKQEIIARIYDAFNKRDIDRVFAHMWPDVDWPNGMEGGRVRGFDAVRAYWVRQWSLINPTVFPIRLSEDPDGNTVVDVHQVIRDLSGITMKDHLVQHVYSFRNGLVDRMEIRISEAQGLTQQAQL